MAIVASQAVPRSNFVTFAKGRPQGAVTGALVGGAETTAAVVILAGTSGPAAPYVLFLAPVFIGAGAAGGALGGAITSVPADKAKEIELAIREWTAGLDSQRALAERVAALTAKAGAVRLASATPADSALELDIVSIEFEGCIAPFPFGPAPCPGGTRNPSLALALEARARLVRVPNGEELFARTFRYRSPGRQLARWTAADARLLTEELQRAEQDLAERIHDALFLASSVELTPAYPGFGAPPGFSVNYGLCWLAPRFPAAKPVLVSELWTLPFARGEVCEMSAIRFGAVDSLQPLLRWDAFPRAIDSADAVAVGYDLKIWEAEECARGALIYERSGLAAPQHRVEQVLAPGQRYLWSFRARFMARGQVMATSWSFFAPGTSCELADIPDGQYHRFVTPAEP